MITPLQMKMARHCLGMTTRQLGDAIEISFVAVSRYERGDTSAISAATAAKAEDFFTRNDVFFGPKDGVCLGENVFATEAWMRQALFRLLDQAGIKPSSTDLINAAKEEKTMERNLPYIAIGNNELGEPAGETIECLFCKQQHPIEYANSRTPLDNGEWSEPEPYKQLGFYKCGDKSYLASVNGRLLR